MTENQPKEEEEEYFEEESEYESDMLFNYKFIEEIGRGSSGPCYLVKDTNTDKYYAAKAYPKSQVFKTGIELGPTKIERLLHEIKILNTLKHPNVLNLIEVIDDDLTARIYLILPYADKGPLSEDSWRSDPMDEESAKKVFKQIGEGLSFLHDHNIVHRDLKPDNILLFSDGRAVISDFSSAFLKKTKDELLDDSDGTPAFKAPEELTGELYDGFKSDVWSFGITLYVMIYGKLPFEIDFKEENDISRIVHISDEIKQKEISFDKEPPVSDELLDLFHALLNKDPKKRVSIKEALTMPWFTL